ncbi:MAG: hypothetical protein ACFCVA_12790, partial [Gammaproteobacteria bacterium]
MVSTWARPRKAGTFVHVLTPGGHQQVAEAGEAVALAHYGDVQGVGMRLAVEPKEQAAGSLAHQIPVQGLGAVKYAGTDQRRQPGKRRASNGSPDFR